jgi:hypothetical protein
MKKQRITAAVLIILSGFTFFILFNKKKSTLDEDIKKFAIEDTSTIDKIFIASKSGESALLERKAKGVWMINGKYKANMESVDLLLYTFRRTEVKYLPAEKANLTIIRSIATAGKKVEIYQDGKRTRIWYIGDATPDHLGTFMVLADPDNDEKYDQPFVNWIPGFDGFLSTRFFTNEADWRDRSLIAALPTAIESVKMQYTGLGDSSFQIGVKSVNSFDVRNLQGIALPAVDTLNVKQYLAYFSRLDITNYLTDKSKRTTDSLRRTAPFAILSIKLKSGKADQYKFYHKKPEAEQERVYQGKFKYDPDNVYVSFNSDADMAMVQYFGFGKLFQTSAYFMPRTVKK